MQPISSRGLVEVDDAVDDLGIWDQNVGKHRGTSSRADIRRHHIAVWYLHRPQTCDIGPMVHTILPSFRPLPFASTGPS